MAWQLGERDPLLSYAGANFRLPRHIQADFSGRVRILGHIYFVFNKKVLSFEEKAKELSTV